MAPSYLHTYPKTFNNQGHLKALPIRKPIKFRIVGLMVITLASIVAS